VQEVLDGDTLGEMAAGRSARDEFVARVSACPGIVPKVARAYCWSATDREDLVQDILAQAWRAYPSYDPARPFGTWLYRVALNVAISWLRTHAPRQRLTVPLDPDLHDTGAAPFDPVAAERVRELTRAIRQLEPLDRALVLLYLDDHSHQEITKLHRLKQRLRQRLESRA
jgi:RNA polymerase sigma factor (sigma-70 family)